jgi:hypothetical protein
MKTISLICLSLFLVAGVGPTASAAEFRTNINPALLYYSSFLVAPQPMAAADSDYFHSKAGIGKNLPDRFGAIVAGYDDQFRLVRQAAHATAPCDWGIDFSVGVNAMLPHLARAKAATQAAQVRAVWDLQHQQPAEARDDLLAVFVLARNASRDGTVIGTLVQFADEAIICATIAQNFGQFPPDTLRQLAEGMAAAPAFGRLADNLPGEKRYVHDWLTEKIRGLRMVYPANDQKVLETIRPDYELIGIAQDIFGGKKDTNLWQRIVDAADGTSEGVLRLLAEADPFYARQLEIMSLPAADYAAPAEAFKADVLKSTNPLIRVLFPFPGIRNREFRMQAEQAMVMAAVEYKLHGESGLRGVPDPCGNGPFVMKRFLFKGEDRGFQLTSAYTGLGYPCTLIFVEKSGTPFLIGGPHAGQATPN